jgi:hypothetical protein
MLTVEDSFRVNCVIYKIRLNATSLKPQLHSVLLLHVKPRMEPGFFSRYSDWAVGWTIEKLRFNFWQGKEVSLDTVQTGSGTHPAS